MSRDPGNGAPLPEVRAAAPLGQGGADQPFVERFLAGLSPLAINYGLLCLVSLFVLVLVLAERGFRTGAVLTGLVGVMAVLFRWRPGIGLVAGCLGGLLVLDGFGAMYHGLWKVEGRWQPANLLLCASFLAFVIGDLRLLSLTRNILPRDKKHDPLDATPLELDRPRSGPPPIPMVRLPESTGTAQELQRVLWSLPIWVILGQFIGLWLSKQNSTLSLHRDVWTLIVIFLGGAALMGLVAFVFSQWRYRTMSPDEAMMILQDECWSETRQDQMLVGRWLAWRRERRERKGSR